MNLTRRSSLASRRVECDWELLPPSINRIVSTHKKKEISVMDKFADPETIEDYVEVKASKQYLSNADLND